MKSLIIVILCLTALVTHANPPVNVIGYEVASLKVEYFESLNSGIITPIGCTQCPKKTYRFDSNIKIFDGKTPVSLADFMANYWNINVPFIAVDQTTQKVIEIGY